MNSLAYREIYSPTHGDVVSQIKSALKYSGWFVYHIWQGKYSHDGIFDLEAIRDGRTVRIEVKTKSAPYLRPKQKQFKKDVEDHGGEARIAFSVDDIRDLLDGYMEL